MFRWYIYDYLLRRNIFELSTIPRTLIPESKITTSHQPEQLNGYSLFLADNLGIILIMKNLPLNRNENKILVDENMNKFLIYSCIKILFSFLLMFGYYESTVLISMSSLFTSNLICLSYFAKLKTDPTNLFWILAFSCLPTHWLG